MDMKVYKKDLFNTPLEHGTYIFDYDFMDNWGGTRHSLAFWEVVKKHPDFSVNNVLGIEMSFQDYPNRKHQKYSDHYRLIIFMKNGARIEFTGFSSGYYGEGSRGTQKVLTDLGLTEKEINFIFEQGNTNWSIEL